MSRQPANSAAPDTLLETAALWFERMQREKVSAQDQAEFDRWLEQGVAHRAAFESAGAAWRLAQQAAGDPQMMALRHETALRLTRKSSRWSAMALRAAAAAVLLAGGLWIALVGMPGTPTLLAQWPLSGDRYATELGERLAVTLHDGSQVTLNTQSRIEARFTEGERKVTLQQGQALFEVAQDAARPFVVMAGGREITALGTAFDVRMDGARVQVTMLEGSVKVRDGGHEVVIAAGQRVLLAAAGGAPEVGAVSDAEAQRATSWRHGQVIFEDTPLAQAVAELNRYSETRIALSDPSLADLRLSGAFVTGRTGVFVEALTRYFPVEVVRSDAREIVLARRAGQ